MAKQTLVVCYKRNVKCQIQTDPRRPTKKILCLLRRSQLYSPQAFSYNKQFVLRGKNMLPLVYTYPYHLKAPIGAQDQSAKKGKPHGA